MDDLEQQAIDGMPVPEPTAPTPDPGQQAPSPVDVRETSEFKEAVKGFQGDYTQKTQALADERRDFQVERASFAQERAQYLEAINRPQEPNEPQPFIEQLPASVQQGLTPEAAQVLNVLGEQNAASIAPLKDEISDMRKTIEQQGVQIQQAEGQTWVRQKEQEAQAVVAKYGAELVKQNADNINGMLTTNRNLSVEQALMASAPDAIREHIRAEEQAKAQEQFKTQYGASLEGINASPGAEPQPAFTAGESMETSAKRTMGTAKYNAMVLAEAMAGQDE